MKKIFKCFSIIFALSLILVKKVMAVCPICTIAVGTGVGLSRWLGIHDSIIGLWIGGLTVSVIFWTESFLDKKKINFKGRLFVDIIVYYLIVISPLYFMGIIATPASAIYLTWFEPLLLGIIVGSIGFWFGAEWYFDLKKNNNGHAYFPFQKVIMPIAPLVILSIVFYLLTI